MVLDIGHPETVGFAATASDLIYENGASLDSFMAGKGFARSSMAEHAEVGLRACAYTREIGGVMDIVFVFRGTVPSEHGNTEAIVTQILNAVTDQAGHPELVNEAVTWMEGVAHQLSNGARSDTCIDVLLAGHSQGGLMGKVSLMRLSKLKQRDGGTTRDTLASRLGRLGCIAFDAPGLSQHDVQEASGRDSAFWENALVEYLFYPNPVNMFGQHALGTLYLLEHDLPATPEWVQTCETVHRIASGGAAAGAASKGSNTGWGLVKSLANKASNYAQAMYKAKNHCELAALEFHKLTPALRWLASPAELLRVRRRVTSWPVHFQTAGDVQGSAWKGAVLSMALRVGLPTYFGTTLEDFQPTERARKQVALAPLRAHECG